MPGAARFGDRCALVITDRELRAMREGAARFGEDCIVLAVPDDATFDQRLAAYQELVRALRELHGKPV